MDTAHLNVMEMRAVAMDSEIQLTKHVMTETPLTETTALQIVQQKPAIAVTGSYN